MDFEQFIKEAAPLLNLQWRRFKRGGIKRKVEHRIADLRLPTLEDYLLKVKKDPEETSRLSQILTVTITRFFRDRKVFDILESSLIPTVAKNKGEGDLKIWSIGCANGEEPYSLSMLWKEKFEKDFPGIRLTLVATDINENLLVRAREGRYKESTLKEIPEGIVQRFFKMNDGFYVLDPSVRESVEFKKHDLIHEDPFPGMDIIFCRNLAFTYFSKECQVDVLKKIASSLRKNGYLVIGEDESLPLTYPTLFVPILPTEKIHQKFDPKSLTSSLSTPQTVS
ncbi:MAG TPA: protein-glutamate O-methyltransferase CheR [Thermodesulfobacteriota bacterium]|nr:protein-glutamate O-methyltransferase CheR [Thermodesulfobacteriota bacterium]